MSYRGKKVGIEISKMDDLRRTLMKLSHLKGKMNISTTFSPEEKIARKQRFEKQKKKTLEKSREPLILKTILLLNPYDERDVDSSSTKLQ